MTLNKRAIIDVILELGDKYYEALTDEQYDREVKRLWRDKKSDLIHFARDISNSDSKFRGLRNTVAFNDILEYRL